MSSLLTLARDLQRRKARERQHLFVAEGVRTVEELLSSSIRLTGVLATDQLAASPRGLALQTALAARGVRVEPVSDTDFGTATDTESPQGVLAIAEIPSRGLAEISRTDRLRLLVLDALQDPGNVGTILRTAAGLGATATIALPGTVDLWNAKVVRSAMGAHFRHPAFHCTWAELDSFLGQQAVPLWAADAGGTPIDDVKPPARLAIAVGNEGAGLAPTVRARAERLIALPVTAGVESLNVAVAAGIILYQLRS